MTQFIMIGEIFSMKKLEDYVLTIPDFPEKGIMFRDVTSVLQDADGLHLAIDTMQDLVKDLDFDVVAGAESRGFIFGTPIAYNMHKPFVLIRKKGKLPRETVSVDYDLEYGKATIEMHKDSIKPGQKVLVVDDLIATGGTTEAMIKLIESLGGEVVGVGVPLPVLNHRGHIDIRFICLRMTPAITIPHKANPRGFCIGFSFRNRDFVVHGKSILLTGFQHRALVFGVVE